MNGFFNKKIFRAISVSFFVFSILLLSGCTTPTEGNVLVANLSATNVIIINPGFETSTASISPWSAFNGSVGLRDISTEEKNSGNNSLRLYNAQSTSPYNVVQEFVGVKANTTYILKAYIKTELTSGACQIDFYKGAVFDSSGTQLVSGTTAWTQYSETFTTPNMTSGYIRLLQVPAVGTCYFDDITLEEVTASSVPAAPTNLIASDISGNLVTLSWTDNSDNETTFNIENAPANNINSVNDCSSLTNWFSPNSTTGHSAQLRQFSPGTKYCFRVSAHNDSGDSAYSNNVFVSFPALPSCAIDPVSPSISIQEGQSATVNVNYSGFSPGTTVSSIRCVSPTVAPIVNPQNTCTTPTSSGTCTVTCGPYAEAGSYGMIQLKMLNAGSSLVNCSGSQGVTVSATASNCSILGDLDGSGNINANDTQLAANLALGSINPSQVACASSFGTWNDCKAQLVRDAA
ncbi:MAG: fibronectin type III domain-containing protein, partial [archaeon]|nr:fibronectin type III domain-containing protein [archaeon]